MMRVGLDAATDQQEEEPLRSEPLEDSVTTLDRLARLTRLR